MRLRKATIENFLIIKKAEVPLDAKDLVLVLGYSVDGGRADSNGVGKSSLFEAVCWCLYGKTYKGLSHDDVISNRSKGGTRVELDLVVGADEITIVRHRGHKKNKNKLHIFINGKNKTPFKQTDAEITLRALLPLSYTAFKHVCYFGQGMGDKFLALNDTGRKQLLEELLGLDIFNKAEKETKRKLKELRLEKVNLEGKMEVLKDNIDDHKERIRDLDTQRAAALAELDVEQAEIAEQQAKLEKEKKLYLKKGDTFDKRLENIKDQLAEAEVEYNSLNKEHRGLEKTLVERESAMRSLKRREKKLSEMSLCGECEQAVSKKHVYLKVAEITEENKAHMDAAESIRFEILEVREQLEEQQELVEAIQSKRMKTREEHQSHTYEVNRLSGLISKNKQIHAGNERRRASVLAPSDSLREALREAKKSLATVESRLSTLLAQEPYLAFWERGFSTTGIRSLLLDDVIIYLNERMNHHSRAISDGEIAIQLAPQTKLKSGELREKMSIEASTGGAGYKAASGGQQRRMDLAVHFALSDLTSMVTGHRINLLICDEVLDCIDETGTDAILEMLGEKTKQGMTVFLIDHTDAVKDNVERILVVTQENGVSTTELT